METTYYKEDLQALALGTCFFASGGGGSLRDGLGLADNFPADGQLTVVSRDVAAADQDHLTAVVAYIGAPDAITHLTKPTAALNAFATLNKLCHGRIKYLAPVELGAASTLVACITAYYENLCVLDADGAGRAVPELTMTTFYGSGVSVQPTILASAGAAYVELNVATAADVEGVVRPFISAGVQGFDEAAGLAMWVMDSHAVAQALPITGTLTRSLALGKLLQAKPADPISAVLDLLEQHGLVASLAYQGLLAAPSPEVTQGGFDTGRVQLNGAHDALLIYNQNENLIAWNTHATSPLIIAPDSICYLTTNGAVFSNADITPAMTGEAIAVIAIQAASALTINPLIMESFQTTLRNAGYPGRYQAWAGSAGGPEQNS